MEVEREKMTLNEPICVSVQVVVHHKTCVEIRTLEHVYKNYSLSLWPAALR